MGNDVWADAGPPRSSKAIEAKVVRRLIEGSLTSVLISHQGQVRARADPEAIGGPNRGVATAAKRLPPSCFPNAIGLTNATRRCHRHTLPGSSPANRTSRPGRVAPG